MSPAGNCPPWNYKADRANLPNLMMRSRELLSRLKCDILEASAIADTRPTHSFLFSDLTPAGFEYFAGHYRGEEFLCLRKAEVLAGGNEVVPAAKVLTRMSEFAQDCEVLLGALDSQTGTEEARLKGYVLAACSAFGEFLEIHPYLDGNGHMGRYVVNAILSRGQYFLRGWPVDPRPFEPDYTILVKRYLSGDQEALEAHILKLVFTSKESAQRDTGPRLTVGPTAPPA
jgi:fido (protein-threonine AMPylation protein)